MEEHHICFDLQFQKNCLVLFLLFFFFSNLKELILFRLPEVRDRQKAENMLIAALPNCDVHFTESRPTKEEEQTESKDT